MLCLRTNLAICQSSTYTPFYPIGAKFSLFSLYMQHFLKYRPIFKIPIFGHETWPLAKVPEVAHILCYYRRGSNWAYFHWTGSGFRDMGQFSKLPYLGMKLGHWPKCQKLLIYPLFTPGGGRNWTYFRCTGSGFHCKYSKHVANVWNSLRIFKTRFKCLKCVAYILATF